MAFWIGFGFCGVWHGTSFGGAAFAASCFLQLIDLCLQQRKPRCWFQGCFGCLFDCSVCLLLMAWAGLASAGWFAARLPAKVLLDSWLGPGWVSAGSLLGPGPARCTGVAGVLAWAGPARVSVGFWPGAARAFAGSDSLLWLLETGVPWSGYRGPDLHRPV